MTPGYGRAGLRPLNRLLLLIRLTEALVRLHTGTMPKELRSEEGTITRHMAVRNTFVFSMLPWVEPFATFLTSQTFRMPVVTERLFALREKDRFAAFVALPHCATY